ncbi:hypothetical protein M8J77_013599 [Diaphorina citri]|nr:hypothetical protein M8J77_013599 [Diaphorina citri]
MDSAHRNFVRKDPPFQCNPPLNSEGLGHLYNNTYDSPLTLTFSLSDKTSSILLAHLQQVQKDLGLGASDSLSSEKDIPSNLDLSQIHKNLLQCNTGRFRQVYSSHQIVELEKEFRLTNYLPSDRRKVLSKELGLTERQIKIWFQNRRMKLKRTHPDMVVEYVKESSEARSASQKTNHQSAPADTSAPNTHMKSFEEFIREHYERSAVPFPASQPGEHPLATGELHGSPLEMQTLMEENASKLLLEKLREQTLEKHLRENHLPVPSVPPLLAGALPPGQVEKLNDLYENERNMLIQELIRKKLGLLIQNNQNGGHAEDAPTDLSRKLKSDMEEDEAVKEETEEEEDSA